MSSIVKLVAMALVSSCFPFLSVLFSILDSIDILTQRILVVLVVVAFRSGSFSPATHVTKRVTARKEQQASLMTPRSLNRIFELPDGEAFSLQDHRRGQGVARLTP